MPSYKPPSTKGWLGFWIETAELKELVKNISGTEVVGKIIEGLSRPHLYAVLVERLGRQANAAEVTRLVEKFPHDSLAVEEPGRNFYIIRFSDVPKIVWLAFGPDSPMFPGIRQRHIKWRPRKAN